MRTAGRIVETECVVCAIGGWSKRVGALAGVELPVEPERWRIAYTGALAIEGELPMTIDFASGFYFHREGSGLLFGTSDVCAMQDEWLERAGPILRSRKPPIARLTERRNNLLGSYV